MTVPQKSRPVVWRTIESFVVAGTILAGIVCFVVFDPQDAKGAVFYTVETFAFFGLMYGAGKAAEIWRFKRLQKRDWKKPADKPEPIKVARVTHEIVSCGQCGQRLRVPCDKGQLKVTCPGCRTQFQFRGTVTQTADIY